MESADPFAGTAQQQLEWFWGGEFHRTLLGGGGIFTPAWGQNRAPPEMEGTGEAFALLSQAQCRTFPQPYGATDTNAVVCAQL